VPPGAVGEIYLAGVQVSRGYLGLPEITKERFAEDAICRGLGEYMYQTGDQGYWTDDGEVMCLGRNDRQIKLRGFRLDLNDLEIRIAKAVTGLKSVAIARRDDSLVAAIQPKSLRLDEVKSEMARALPVHAMPRHIVLVDEFPTTRAGKLDYKAIIQDSFLDFSASIAVLNTSTEVIVADIWRKLLKLSQNHRLHVLSDFFELGGNSLLQITLLAKLSTAFKLRIPLKAIIEHTTIRDLAATLDQLIALEKPVVQEALNRTNYVLSPMEKEWWHRYKYGHSVTSFNLSYVAEFSPSSVNKALLARAFDLVLERHQIFRVRYVPRGTWGVEKVYTDAPPRVRRLRTLDVWGAVNRPFNISQDSPIRIYLSSNKLVIILSHIVGDLTSVQVLLDEVKTLYDGRSLPAIEQTYAQWVSRNKDPASCDLQFWALSLSDLPKKSICPKPLDEKLANRGTSQLFEFGGNTYERLLALSSKFHISLQQIAMAAIALVISIDSSSVDVVLGSPFMNRVTDSDLRTVGLFLEPLPVRVTYDPSKIDSKDPMSYLHTVCATSKASVGHAVPWRHLLSQLGFDREPTDNPIFEVMVTFHGADQTLALDIPSLRPCLSWSEGAKFPLMAEFTGLKNGKMILRMEYEMRRFERHHIRKLATLVADTLTGFADGKSFTDIKATLEQGGSSDIIERSDAFGRAIEDI
jgi:gliotoxin/aspirochlorine biosynthesis peptide synthetase